MPNSNNTADRNAHLSAAKQALLEKRLAGASTKSLNVPRIPRRAGNGPLWLSFAQQRLWFLDRLEGGGATYNVPYAYRLKGALSVELLERSLGEIERRHEILRTRVAVKDGLPVQVIDSPRQVKLAVEDVPGEGLPELVRSEITRGFDLEQGPLMRVRLFRLAAEEHVLLMTFHHIVFDGWSEGVVFRELRALYTAYAEGRESPLPELPIQYADYALWQREYMNGEVLERQLKYWKECLGGDRPELELRGDHVKPAAPSHRGVTELLSIPAPVCSGVLALSRREGVTPFMTLLTAFAVLMNRYSDQEDIVVGTPIAGRTRLETEELVGFFVNSLPLRVDLRGNPPFADALARIKEVALGAYEHQEVPFERLVEELHPQRIPGLNPVFQVMFVMQTAAKERPGLPGLSMEKMETDTETAKFDVTLSLAEKEGRFDGWLECNADIFERETISRMGGCFETLLERIIADPSRPIHELPLMDDVERQRVLVEWNSTSSDYPRDSSIQRVFEEQCARTPDARAAVSGSRHLTYGELNGRANRLARYLRSRGVSSQTPVAICMERSLDMVIALLAVLKSGGAYVPLDPGYPGARLSFMIEDAGVRVLLTQEPLLRLFSGVALDAICPEREGNAIARQPGENLSEESRPDDLAYVIYTSGSTGKPKGVCIPHRGVLRLVRGTDYARLDAEQVVLQFASLSFDASTFEIWGALLNGGCLAILPPQMPSIEELGDFIRRNGVTTVWLTAPLFQQIVESGLDFLAGVKQLLAGGDVLSVPHVKRFMRRYPHCRLINGYGPTENTTFTCCHQVTDADRLESTVPIGRPVKNTTVYILDRYLQPVPPGIPGELYTGGDGLALGYLNSPELTRERFVRSPFGGNAGERLYRTGDRARFRPDGAVEFLGRLDDQAKIRGFRVEPKEIETVLLGHAGVKEAVVVTREDVPGDRRLVAYCVPQDQMQVGAADLRSYLKEKVPEYMIPSAFVLMETMPLNTSGKVDRAGLPPPASIRAEGDAVTPAQQNPAEGALLAIWSQVLGVTPVGPGDNFFDLGGHSLLAMQVISRIREVFQIDLPLLSLFENPTVAGMAQLISEKLTDEIEKMSDDEASGQR